MCLNDLLKTELRCNLNLYQGWYNIYLGWQKYLNKGDIIVQYHLIPKIQYTPILLDHTLTPISGH